MEKSQTKTLPYLTKLYQACLYGKVKVIGLQVLQENNDLQLANQSACYIGYKNKSFNSNEKTLHITNLQFFIDDHFADSAVHHRRRQIKHFSQRIQTANKDGK